MPSLSSSPATFAWAHQATLRYLFKTFHDLSRLWPVFTLEGPTRWTTSRCSWKKCVSWPVPVFCSNSMSSCSFQYPSSLIGAHQAILIHFGSSQVCSTNNWARKQLLTMAAIAHCAHYGCGCTSGTWPVTLERATLSVVLEHKIAVWTAAVAQHWKATAAAHNLLRGACSKTSSWHLLGHFMIICETATAVQGQCRRLLRELKPLATVGAAVPHTARRSMC